jgi:hypothetical protein
MFNEEQKMLAKPFFYLQVIGKIQVTIKEYFNCPLFSSMINNP